MHEKKNGPDKGRKTLTLYNSNSDRSSVSYARYLVSVKEGRFLTKNEEVDHKNDDRRDDRIENLQILTPLENHKKSVVSAQEVTLKCDGCGTIFKRKRKHETHKDPNHKKFCSRPCMYAHR